MKIKNLLRILMLFLFTFTFISCKTYKGLLAHFTQIYRLVLI